MDKQLLNFSKYEGAGNDFILVDAYESEIHLSIPQIQRICDRRFGVGADGLIFIRPSIEADYEMVYHNSDGDVGSMCGNGARCAFTFARMQGYVGDTCGFMAYDGMHTARLLTDGQVEVSMSDVVSLSEFSGDCVLDTGSPHYVRFVHSIEEVNVVEEGRSIRYSEPFRERGINVNFVEVRNNFLRLRTYERGVEAITLACGTGATAVALAHADREELIEGPIVLKADGGELCVNFKRTNSVFANIVLQGPAHEVFTGVISLSR